ncbi:MAG TPA: hypothetical protein VIQ31_26460 [Phormidium sp.]
MKQESLSTKLEALIKDYSEASGIESMVGDFVGILSRRIVELEASGFPADAEKRIFLALDAIPLSEITTYKFHAKTYMDIDDLRSFLKINKVKKYIMEASHNIPDQHINVTIKTTATFDELVSLMRQVIDGHLMVETLEKVSN